MTSNLDPKERFKQDDVPRSRYTDRDIWAFGLDGVSPSASLQKFSSKKTYDADSPDMTMASK